MKEIKRTHCMDCNAEGPSTHYFFGSRCPTCHDAFQEKLQAERVARWAEEKRQRERHRCGKDIPDAADTCPECCEHEFDSSEGGYCLNCDGHVSDHGRYA